MMFGSFQHISEISNVTDYYERDELGCHHYKAYQHYRTYHILALTLVDPEYGTLFRRRRKALKPLDRGIRYIVYAGQTYYL